MAAGGKGKARGKRQKAASRSQTSPKSFVRAGESRSDASHPFTLQQEAFNTERKSLWRPGLRLRDNKVAFVRGSDPDPAEETQEDAQEEIPEQTLGVKGALHPPANDLPASSWLINPNEHAPCQDKADEVEPSRDPSIHSKPAISEKPLFYVDTSGTPSTFHTGLLNPTIRAESPTPSESGSDVVVFTGRNKPRNSQQERQTHPVDSIPASKYSVTPADDAISAVHLDTVTVQLRTTVLEHGNTIDSKQSLPEQHLAADLLPLAPGNGRKNGKKRLSRAEQRRREEEATEAAILADYIENMAQDVSSDDEAETGLSRIIETERPMSWGSEDLEDLDILSTSDELPEELGGVYSKRERGKRLQYLIVGKDQTPDYARWIAHELLTMPGAEEQIRLFEEEEKLNKQFQEDSKSSEDISAEEFEDILSDDDDSEHDEQELLERQRQRMTDEQVARALEKQALFGMPTEEVLLFDDLDEEEIDDSLDDDLTWTKAPRSSTRVKKSKQRRTGQYPNASAFADTLEQYSEDAFDIMDWDRPSLKAKANGRRDPRSLQLSDSELESALRQSWETDRQKKKARKQEREELRALGLLGQKSGKVDMKAKYAEGLSIDELKTEIKGFLLSSSDSLALPPMDNQTRKVVHELARLVALNSKSRGSGSSRFPVLYKTSRTSQYTKSSIGFAETLLNTHHKRFLPRMDKRGGGKKGNPGLAAKARGRRPGGGSGVTSGAHYMDGEIVGASAPEIGAGNKGRSMLEKMGWSQGTALGALHNKGILMPVEHRVKSTKAGLG